MLTPMVMITHYSPTVAVECLDIYHRKKHYSPISVPKWYSFLNVCDVRMQWIFLLCSEKFPVKFLSHGKDIHRATAKWLRSCFSMMSHAVLVMSLPPACWLLEHIRWWGDQMRQVLPPCPSQCPRCQRDLTAMPPRWHVDTDTAYHFERRLWRRHQKEQSHVSPHALAPRQTPLACLSPCTEQETRASPPLITALIRADLEGRRSPRAMRLLSLHCLRAPSRMSETTACHLQSGAGNWLSILQPVKRKCSEKEVAHKRDG